MSDDTGHRTATIPRPAGAAAKSKRRAGAARDDGGRLLSRRRSRVIMAMLAAVVAGSLAASVLILPVKAWMNQREELTNREKEVAKLNAANDSLQADVDRLETDTGVIEAAREELGEAADNEKVYRVIDDPALTDVLPEGWLYPTIAALLISPGGTGPAPVAAEPAPDAGADTTIAGG